MEFHPPEYINQRLRDYGVSPGGRPYFRLVLSHTQFEKRKGHYSESGIFLGENNTVIREVPKYPYIPENTWILEVLAYQIEGDRKTNPEMINDTSYEPIWSFPTGLPPHLGVAREVVRNFRRITSSPKEEEEKEQLKLEAEQKRDYEIIDDATSTPITSHLHSGSGIIVPENYE